MKKLTAMLLALCMLLAAVPALGDGPSGTWYLTLADVTLGHIYLNEDSTAQVALPGQDAMEGTWTADDASVTVTIDGDALTFAYDGTSLSSEMLPLPIVREEGKIGMDLISKIMNGEDYELPEGMTQADMAAITLNFMTEFQKIQGSFTGAGSTGSGSEPSGTEPAASADPELTFLSENFFITESYSGFRAVYLAKVQNDTGAPLYIRDGAMQVADASGNQAGEAKYLSVSGSRYLEPGEATFIQMNADLEADGEYTYTREIEVKAEGYRTDRAVTVTETSYVPAQDYDNAYLRATVVNDTDAPLAGLEVVFALLDAEGNLLDVREEQLYRHELGAGSTITMVTSVDGKITEYLAAKGIEPASVEAFAWVENKD